MRSGKIALLLMLLMVVPAFAGLITFEDLTSGYAPGYPIAGRTQGTTVGNQYAGSGVLFSPSGTPDMLAYVSDDSYYAARFADYAGTPTGHYLGLNTDPEKLGEGTLTVIFTSPVKSLGLMLADTEFSVRLQTFDVLGNLIDTWTWVDPNSMWASPSFASATPIRSLLVTDVGGDGLAMDGLSYEFAAPEPGTWILLAAGLGAFGLLRRRRSA
jgi:hypothetical protein